MELHQESPGETRSLFHFEMLSSQNNIPATLLRTHEIVRCHFQRFCLPYLLYTGSVTVMEKLNIEQERLMDLVQLKHHIEAF